MQQKLFSRGDIDDDDDQISDDPDSVLRFSFSPYLWGFYQIFLTLFAFTISFYFKPLILGQIFFVIFVLGDKMIDVALIEKKRREKLR